MNFLIPRLLCACLMLAPAPVLADEWLATMTRTKDCITGLENAQLHFDRVNRHWLTDESSAFHVRSRFNQLLDQHQLYRDQIDQFSRRYDPRETNSEKILDQLRDLERAHNDMLAGVPELSAADDAFVASMYAVNEAVAVVADKYASLKEICAQDAAEEVQSASDVIADVRAELAGVTGYVTAAAQKRGDLFLSVYYGIEARLTARYAQLVSLSLQDARQKIRTIMLAEQFLDRVRSWWLTAHGRSGLGGGLAGPYLQYHQPLAVMKRDLAAGEVLEKELAGLSSADGDLYRAVASELSSRMSALRSAIATLEQRGAGGTFDLQVATNARRRDMLRSYQPACEAAIKAFDEAARPAGAPPGDETRFNAERTYIDVVLSCRRAIP
jgi:hypothetical protein